MVIEKDKRYEWDSGQYLLCFICFRYFLAAALLIVIVWLGPCLSVLLHFLSKRGYSLFEEIPFESKLHIMVARPRVLGGSLNMNKWSDRSVDLENLLLGVEQHCSIIFLFSILNKLICFTSLFYLITIILVKYQLHSSKNWHCTSIFKSMIKWPCWWPQS